MPSAPCNVSLQAASIFDDFVAPLLDADGVFRGSDGTTAPALSVTDLQTYAAIHQSILSPHHSA